MMASIQLSWETARKVKAGTPELKAGVCRIFAVDDVEDDWRLSTKEHIADDVEMQWLADQGVPFEVKKFRGSYAATTYLAAKSPEKSEVVHVHLPNLGLLSMNEVVLLEDACTDELQRTLDDGYRIICVCPPAGTRRPDYILGRAKDSGDRGYGSQRNQR